MADRTDISFTVRVRLETRALFDEFTREFRLSNKDGMDVLLAGWNQLTEEQQFAAIRGGAVHDPGGTYHDPNSNQEETDPIGDSVLSPARA